jgi:chaperonin GroES
MNVSSKPPSAAFDSAIDSLFYSPPRTSQVEEATTVTSGGMLIPNAAGKERPSCGEVVRTGPGKKGEEGKMPVKAGDKVIYFKYAGEVIPTASGARYAVVHAQDILCKNS